MSEYTGTPDESRPAFHDVLGVELSLSSRSSKRVSRVEDGVEECIGSSWRGELVKLCKQ